MRIFLTLAASVLLSATAFAQEPAGCDKFKWPIERERAAMTADNLPTLASAAAVNNAPPMAFILALRPLGDAGLPSAPERAPKPGTYAGYIDLKSIPPAVYTINLSAAAWVDVLANGVFLKPEGFSGATGCEGIRKTMKYRFSGPVLIQVSGVIADPITLALMPSSSE